MEHIINCIVENKEWLFGGHGISILSGCGTDYCIMKGYEMPGISAQGGFRLSF